MRLLTGQEGKPYLSREEMRLYVFPLHGKRDKGKETAPENALSALSDAKAHFLRGALKKSLRR